MAQVLIARGKQWVNTLPRKQTPHTQATLSRYIKGVEVGNRWELWAYMASGALSIRLHGDKNKPLDRHVVKAYGKNTLVNTWGVTLNASLAMMQRTGGILNANRLPANKTKVRSRVIHNAKGNIPGKIVGGKVVYVNPMERIAKNKS